MKLLMPVVLLAVVAFAAAGCGGEWGISVMQSR